MGAIERGILDFLATSTEHQPGALWSGRTIAMRVYGIEHWSGVTTDQTRSANRALKRLRERGYVQAVARTHAGRPSERTGRGHEHYYRLTAQGVEAVGLVESDLLATLAAQGKRLAWR